MLMRKLVYVVLLIILGGCISPSPSLEDIHQRVAKQVEVLIDSGYLLTTYIEIDEVFSTDSFTSIGILGTFVGLVWGLKDFQPSDYEAMTSSVSSLVDGIKVAFLTSIYGIAFSIVLYFRNEERIFIYDRKSSAVS